MTLLTTLLLGVVLLQIEQPDAGAARPTPEDPPARPTVPGEPTVDPTLTPGTLIIELLDARKSPLAKAKIIIESSSEAGRGRRLEAETDASGRLRVEDLPTGENATIVAGHEGRGGVLTSTRPFGLPTEGGARVLLMAPERTSDPGMVSIEHLHVVLERERHQIRVVETFGLAAEAGAVFSNERGLTLPIAAGASGLRFKDAENASKTARLEDDGVVITAPIPPGGTEITIVFDVPIDDGRAVIDQAIPLRVGSAQVISTWTRGGARLIVEGFSEAEQVELRTGLTALVAAVQGLPEGRLKLQLEGITDGPAGVRRMLTLLASLGILGFGLALWFWGRLRRTSDGGSGE